jgi:catechol 2,3-dioxygenase-like lactoylglutathione lyase family enzyme
VEAVSHTIRSEEGEKLVELAQLPTVERGVVPITLQEFVEPVEQRHAHARLDHDIPFKRLDHLAAIAPDLDAATRYWADTLGIPQTGEVTNPAMIIRQFKIGDANFELLGPATPESPLRNRPPGLISMVALEVAGLAAAVAQAREAGFTVSDPAPGALPGTRAATIPADQLGGLSLQMLEYV